LTVLTRSYRTLLLNIAVPILILVITSLHGKNPRAALGLTNPGFDISLALTYGLMASSLMGYTIAVARDRDTGVLQRLRLAPVPTWTIMTSRLLVQLVVDLLMTVIVLVVGTILRGGDYSAGQYLLIIAVSVLGGAVYLAIGQAVVGLVTSVNAVNAVARVLYIVFLLLGLLGSSGVLGTTTQTIAGWSPVGALVSLYSAVLNPGSWDRATTDGLVACAAYVLLGTYVGTRWFRWNTH
jgi:ABC-2 type transport system permease protein